jgi:hypothetical protein
MPAMPDGDLIPPAVTTKPKLKTVSLNPKVPAQALASIVAFVLARYGIELDAATSGPSRR